MTQPRHVAPPALRIIRIAADLEVGDWLRRGDREYLITRLNPATRAETLAAGRREAWSLGSCYPFDAGDPVQALPHGRPPRQPATPHHAERTAP